MNKAVIVNVLAQQVGWFGLVLGVAYGQPLFGCIICMSVIIGHFAFSQRPKVDATLVLLATLIGIVIENMNTWSQIYEFLWWPQVGWPYPYWLILLWSLLGITIRLGFSFLSQWSLVPLVLFGAIGGPLAFMAGMKLGAITIVGPSAWVQLSIEWAIVFPVLVRVSRALIDIERVRTSTVLR